MYEYVLYNIDDAHHLSSSCNVCSQILQRTDSTAEIFSIQDTIKEAKQIKLKRTFCVFIIRIFSECRHYIEK